MTLLIIALVIVLIIYVGISAYFVTHFSFKTYVNDKEAFGKTAGEVEEEMLSHVGDYVLTVHARGDITETIDSASIDLQPQMSNQFRDILKSQNPFAWPVCLFKETRLTTETVVGYSESKLDNIISGLSVFDPENVVEPEDAHISDESGDKGFFIVPETDGSKPVDLKVRQEIKAAVGVMDDEVTLSDECYESASIKGDDQTLNTLCDNLNRYCSVNITYEFGDDVIKVNGSRVKEWCAIEGTSVTLDETRIKDFVNELARTYDTFGKTRHLKSHTGETVEVKGGDYGWWMDRATETTQLTEAVLSGASGKREPVYFGKACQYGENDWGDSYVEVDLDAQHVYVYRDGQLVEDSDCVSGCVNKKRVTPVGTYSITYKETDTYLTGDNYSSHVDYWMPFNGNVGLHDASWRSSFGGDIYVTNGSHGCVNLPTKKAASIYDIIQKGEAVLVYGGKEPPEEEEELTPEQEQLKLLIEAGLLDPSALQAQTTEGGGESGAQSQDQTQESAQEQVQNTAEEYPQGE